MRLYDISLLIMLAAVAAVAAMFVASQLLG